MNPAPMKIAEIMDSDWLTAALSQRYPGAAVRSVDVVKVLGPVATKVRFTVDYADQPAGAPHAMCAKGILEETMPQALLASGMSERETRFYREIAPVSTVRVPRLDYAGIDDQTRHGLIITEDLYEAGCTFLGALVHRTIAQTRDTLDQLARLHATCWNGQGLEQFPWLRPEFRNLSAKPYLSVEDQQALMDDPRKGSLPADVLSAQRLYAGMKALAEIDATLPECICHGDFHAGNLYVDAEGRPGVLDWQIVQRAHWALDVSYHLGTVLTTADREAGEQELLRYYLERLREHGVTPPTWDEAWFQYRIHMVYGYYQWAVTRWVRPVEIIYEFFQRLGAAVSSLDSYGLLKV